MSAKGKPWGRRFTEEVNTGKEAALAAIDELYDTDVVIHGPGEEGTYGLKKHKQFTSEFYDAFPDTQMTFDDRIVKGNKVVTRFTITGTQKGEYMGIPPTNKKVTWRGIEIFRRAGGKIVEVWAERDNLGMLQQLGVIPAQG